MKKIFASLTSVILVFGLFMSTAGAEPANTQNLKEIQKIQNDLVSYLKQEVVNNTEEANQGIDLYFQSHPVDQAIITEYFVNTSQKTVLPETEKDNNKDFNSYVSDNVDNGTFTEQEISDNVKIVLTDSPFFIVETVTTDETPIDDNILKSSDFTLTATAASKATKTNTYNYVVKSMLGNTAFTITVQGYFTYNGTAVNPHLVDAWYTKGTLSIWQVDNWEEGVTYEMSGKVRIYGRGNFHFGVEIAGYGLVVQDKFIVAFQEGDKDGGVLFDRTVN